MAGNDQDTLDDFDDLQDPARMQSLQEALWLRCQAASIKMEKSELVDEENTFASKVFFPAGRSTRIRRCHFVGDYESLLDFNFEKYSFLQGLDAICNYAEGTIEAGVSALADAPNVRSIMTGLLGISTKDYGELRDGSGVQINVASGNSGFQVSLGDPSTELRALVRPSARLSLKIQRADLTQHDHCLNVVKNIADSLFFQMELAVDIPLTLNRSRAAPRRKSWAAIGEMRDYSFPTHEYDPAPISLYWYARGARGMPLLQYLAFYQAIEFYYPTYSEAEARRKLKKILKDPTFRGDREADLGRVLSAIQTTRTGGYGDERSQLKATLTECLDAEILYGFLNSDAERKAFFGAKAKGLTDKKLTIPPTMTDLRAEVAERIYEIRCKIVHTKTDAKFGELELLLPFSKEAESMHFDIELVKFVAQQVLISSSSAFNLAHNVAAPNIP